MIVAIITSAAMLAGVLAGALLTHAVNRSAFERELTAKRAESTASRLEEIASTAQRIGDCFFERADRAVTFVHTGEREAPSYEKIPIDPLTMLVRFHAPELQHLVDKLLDEREKLGGPLVASHGSEVRTMTEKQELNGKLYAGAQRIVLACSRIVSAAAKLAHERLAAGRAPTHGFMARLRGAWDALAG